MSIALISCNKKKSIKSILNDENINCGLILKDIIEKNGIDEVKVIRPFGNSFDTVSFNLKRIGHLYGERLFTLGNEKFQCKDIDSLVHLNRNILTIKYNMAGYDNSGPFTQEYVSDYWKSGNGYLLNKELPSFQGRSYLGAQIDLDSLISNSEMTLLHFGWLSCKGCMLEQNEIVKLIHRKPEIKFVNMTIDKAERLDKFLIDRGDYFELKAPYNRQSKSMIKPILFDEKEKIFDYFHLRGLFPVNFLVDSSGNVRKIGSLLEIFKTENDSIEVFRVN